MDAFDVIRQWASTTFGVPEERLTRETTLDELVRLRPPEPRAPEDEGIETVSPLGVSADSLERIELIMMLEEDLDLQIADEDAAEAECLWRDPRTTLGELAALIDRGKGEE